MKLVDKIISDLDFKESKNSSLVSSMEKIKYHDLLAISDIIDNPKFLNTFSMGWNPIHYACMNNNLEVLFFIANLYIKNNCDLNQFIQREKNGVKLQSNTLDITLYNQKLEHYILLKSLNLPDKNSIGFWFKNNNKKFTTNEELNLKFPYEFCIVNLFMGDYNCIGLKLLSKDFEYEEKPQIIKEFLTNHIYMCKNHINSVTFGLYDDFFKKLTEQHLKNNLDLNIFDFFALPLIESFKKNVNIYFSLENFNNIYLTNPSGFLDSLTTSSYKKPMIETFYLMQQYLENQEGLSSNLTGYIKKFLETYFIDKLIFSLELSTKLPAKNINSKLGKI